MNNLGLHIIGDWLNPAKLLGPNGEKPRVVKLVDPSVEFVRMVRRTVGDDCLIIIRFYERDQSLGAPQAAAQAWYMRHIGQILAMTDPNVAFEGYNEIADSAAHAYAQFELERLRLLHAAGQRAVIGNWSVGTPDIPIWATYRPVLEALKPGDFVGLHEYWADAEMLNNPWFCGRWVHVPELQALRPEQVIITECGRDNVAGRGGPWQGYVDASTYTSELARYAQIAAPRLATVFTGGNTTGWEGYDVNAIWPNVTAHYTAPSPPETPRPEQKIRLRAWLNHWDRWMITQPFGARNSAYTDGWHKGVDMIRNDGGTLGAVIFAPFDGIVDVVSWRHDRGWYLYLYDEFQAIEFFVCHLAQEPQLRPSQRVVVGAPIGVVGNTGRLTTGPHLHVGICHVDPETLEIERWIDPFGDEVEIQV